MMKERLNGKHYANEDGMNLPWWSGNLLSFLLRCGTWPYERSTQGLLVEGAKHYTTRGASCSDEVNS